MEFWAFLGGFAAVALGIWWMVHRVRGSLNHTLNLGGLLPAVLALNQQPKEPRSLNGADSIVLPRILRDFPDFDATIAKTYAREYLREQLADRKALKIHQVVFSDYLPSAAQKTIVLQAALSYREQSKTIQTRYDLSYSYLLPTGNATIAANCPNCGANLGFGDRVCAYCGSRVVNVLGNTWKFTDMKES